MKKIAFVVLLACMCLSIFAGAKSDSVEQESTRTIVDMAGRSVEVSAEIDSVFSTNPIGTIFLYTLAPEKMVAWNFAPNDAEMEFIAKEQQTLPAFGQDARVNYEAVLSANPDVILVYFQAVNDKLFSDIEALESALAKPIVAIKGQLVDADETYEFLGDLLGMEKESKERADYVRAVFKNENKDTEKVSVYFGDGVASLDTIPNGSPSSQELDLAGVENVADIAFGSQSRVSISSEQILAWNPEIVLLNGEPKENISQNMAVQAFLENPIYNDISAVKTGRVYGVPKTPFSWVGRPIGVNRLIGVQWIEHLAYGDGNADFESTVKEFYDLFYHIELTESEVKKILGY